MPRNRIFFLFLILFFVFGVTVLWAGAATVTNDGNITVRVQYKTPDGDYQDMYVRPGETADIPGGVEKVKLVREPGRWAEPRKPGENIEVVVKEGDKVTGRMNWYGDKVFFNGLTEGPPAISVGNVPTGPQVNQVPPQNPEPPKSEPSPSPAPPSPEKPEGGETPQQPNAPDWPWYGGMGDYLFFLELFLMWPFLIFLWFRSWMQPRYYLNGEWVEGSGLGWGWGWNRGGGCGRYGMMNGFFLGLALGAIALWGHSFFSPGAGFLQLFGRDLYAFPYLVLSQLHWMNGGLPESFFIILFWTLLCTSCGAFAGVIPLKWLYATPFFLAILPLFLFMRGCACSHPFVFDGGYGSGEFYPPAFATFFSFSMLVSFFLDLVDPYYEMDWDEEDHAADALWDFFHGNPWPLLVFLTGGCLCCFYGMAYYYGWDYAISSYFYDAPMSLGLSFISAPLVIILFWMGLAGMLGWASYSEPARLPFYLLLIPAFLVLLVLTMGNYPQRDLSYIYRQPIPSYSYYNLTPQISQKPSESEDQFGDTVRSGGWGSSSGSGRNLMFGVEQRGNRERENRYRE